MKTRSPSLGVCNSILYGIFTDRSIFRHWSLWFQWDLNSPQIQSTHAVVTFQARIEERGKPEYPEKNLSEREEKRTNNKLNPHTTAGPGIEPGTHWWEARALTTAPSLLPQMNLIGKKLTTDPFTHNFQRAKTLTMLVKKFRKVQHLQTYNLGQSN